jgi:hypothetical protein
MYMAHSQGFNWQYSSRLPMDYPEFFIGLSVGASYFNNSGQIRLDEGEVLDCCSFSSGNGWGSNFGLSAEYWHLSDLALFAALRYSIDKHTFTKQRIGEFRVTDTLHYENSLSSSTNYLMIEFGGKKNIPDSHFHYGISILASILINNNNEIREKIIKPVYFPWSERVVSRGRISNLTSIYLQPKLRFGYDLDLGLSTYSTISINIGIPIFDMTEQAEWKSWQIGAEVVIWRGLI